MAREWTEDMIVLVALDREVGHRSVVSTDDIESYQTTNHNGPNLDPFVTVLLFFFCLVLGGTGLLWLLLRLS